MSDSLDSIRDDLGALLAYANSKLDSADESPDPDRARAEAGFAIAAALDVAEGVRR